MATTLIERIFIKDGLGGSVAGINYTMRENCIVEFSEPVTNIIDAIRISGFRKGERHRNKGTLYLNNGFTLDVHDDTNAAFWVFSLTYSTLGDTESATDDEDYRPKVSFSKWSYPIVVDRDKETQEALMNYAGDPYDPLPVRQISAPILNVTVKEFNPKLGNIQLIGSVNIADVTICGVFIPAYCGMFDDYQTTSYHDDEDNLIFENTYSIKLKYFRNRFGKIIGFKLETLQAGFNQIVNGKKVEIRVADPEFPDDRKKDVPVAEPQLIDEDGALLDGLVILPVYKENVVDDLYDFRLLALPTAYPVI